MKNNSVKIVEIKTVEFPRTFSLIVSFIFAAALVGISVERATHSWVAVAIAEAGQ